MEYIKRQIEKCALEISETFPVLMVTGPRQVGKTTMLKHIADGERKYVTLDNPSVRFLATSDPMLFLQTYSPPLIIDEIQYAPELLSYIKMYVDEHHDMGGFWLTGSQMFQSMKNVSESLAGRVGILNMQSLSYSEIIGAQGGAYQTEISMIQSKAKVRPELDLKETYNYIFKGGMPALYDRKVDLNTYFESYLQTYLQRDIRDLAQVGNEMAFYKFIVSVAARTGQQLNMADLARDAEISQPTAKQWLSILVSTGIVFLLQPYFNNTLKRLTKTPKVYFMDTGLCVNLTKWHNAQILESGAMAGAIFETWVVSELVKSYYNVGKQPSLYFYRDKDQQEVDVVIWENGRLFPIEIKKSANPKMDAIKNFGALKKTKLEIGTGNVICLYPEVFPIDTENWFVPVGLI